MKTSKIVYQGDLRTIATHIKSGKEVITDAPTDNQGKGDAFSPTDLLATALGSCMLTIMGIAGNTHKIDIEGITMDITKVMAADPRRVCEVIVEFNMTNNTYSDKEKAILQNAALTCPVAKSLSTDLKQTVNFNY
jgi:uncharacterized OsmC-like protein